MTKPNLQPVPKANEGQSARSVIVAPSRDIVEKTELTIGNERPPLGTLDEADFENRTSRPLIWGSFLLLVIGPACLVGWFLSERASPRFTSEFRIAVRSLDLPRATGAEGLFSLAGISAPVANDSQALVQYVESRAIIDLMDAAPELSFDDIYAREDIDVFSGIEPNAPVETRVKHWNRFVRTQFETSSNTIIIKVTTFTQADALALSQLLLRVSGSFVNEISQLARFDAVNFAQEELMIAETRARDARTAMLAFQEREQVIDPREAVIANMAMISRLQEDLTLQKITLAEQSVDLDWEGRLVQSTLARIAVLEEAIENLQSEATQSAARSDADATPLSQVLFEFSELTSDAEFAQHSYLSALGSLEGARIEASRQKMFLATIVPPGLPEVSSYPKPARGTLTTLAVAFALWLVGLVGLQIVREHA
jgi:capsular polysaccharide transport system permease protein